MINPRKAAFRWCKIDSFSNVIVVMLINPNQNLEAMLKSLFSMRTLASIHPEVVLEIRGDNQPFMSSRY